VATVEDHLAALAEAQWDMALQLIGLTRVVSTLSDDVAVLKGDNLERRYRERALAYFAPLIRRTHVLLGDGIEPLPERAVAQGQLSEAEADEILLADLLLHGRRREDNSEVYLVVEVSWKVDPYDVERAVRRATLLSRIGLQATPVVAGKEIIEEAANLAGMLRVWRLTNGQAVPP
jgi:hypothetical protein